MSTSDRVLHRLRRLCLSLPESTEVGSWGHPNFRAGKRTFATFERINGRPSIAFRLNTTDVDLLLRRKRFFVTPYGRGQWVSVWADGALHWDLVERLLQRSYRVVALKTVKTFVARTAGQWREWLDEHHDSESEVWLIFYKQHTGLASIAYEDAVNEALCFGWVDSLIKRLDDSRYARKFTPRKANSRWSATNRKRYAELKASGELKPAGIDRGPTGRGYDTRPSLPSTVPPYIQAALRKHPAALRTFDGLAPSHRRRYVGWIDSAKQEETKARRLKEAIRLLAAGKPLGLK